MLGNLHRQTVERRLGIRLVLGLVCAWLSLLYAMYPGLTSAADTPTTLRVCTYNMLGFQGWPEEVAQRHIGTGASARLAHFTEVLAELDCDILGVQEGSSQQWITRLAANLGQSVAFTPSPAEFPGGIFSRYPIVEERPRTVTVRSWEVPFSRTLGAALIDAPGMQVWVVNLHAHPNREELRLEESGILARTVEGLLAENPNVIVLGDFNSQVGTPLHDVLSELGFVNAIEVAWGRTVATVNSKDGGIGSASIDHIYLSESLSRHLISARVVLDSGFMMPFVATSDDWVHSDHVPVVAELRW